MHRLGSESYITQGPDPATCNQCQALLSPRPSSCAKITTQVDYDTGTYPALVRYLDTEQGYDQLLVEDDDTGQQLAAYTGRLPAPAPALTAPPTTRALRLRFTSDAVPKYGGFYLRYWVLPPDLLAAFRPPPPPPYAKAALRSAFAKAGEGALCDPVLVTHGSGYFTAPGGAFITSDMRWRLGQAGVGEQEDGSQRPLDMARLQLLPPGDPGGWLQPYAPGTDCTWLLALPAAATATLVVRWAGSVDPSLHLDAGTLMQKLWNTAPYQYMQRDGCASRPCPSHYPTQPLPFLHTAPTPAAAHQPPTWLTQVTMFVLFHA